MSLEIKNLLKLGLKAVVVPIAVFSIYSNIAISSEVDSFSDRYEILEDSLEALNKSANKDFLLAVKEANKKSSNCDEKKLHEELQERFRNHVQGTWTRWLAHTDSIQKRRVPNSTSIYKDFKWYEAFTAAIKNIYKDTAADVINVNGHIVGTDKFEHFFGRGFAYFQRMKKMKPGHDAIMAVLNYGHFSERYILGANSTGVYSYGDLAANFHGMRFWNHLLQEQPDVFGKNIGPYLSCKNNKWVPNFKAGSDLVFNFKNYVDLSWDEGNNCAAFRTKNLLNKVKTKISELESDGRQYACPINPKEIKDLAKKYAPYDQKFINTTGHRSIK